MTAPVAVFRCWCDRKRTSGFYAVMLYPTKAGMLAKYREVLRAAGLPTTGIRDTEAAVLSWYQAVTLHPKQYGVILMHLGNIGAGLVSHEMTHASLYWVGRQRDGIPTHLDLDSKTDERLAWVQGWLVTQFWRWWYRLEKRGIVKRT